jgi:hypothetical protein
MIASSLADAVLTGGVARLGHRVSLFDGDLEIIVDSSVIDKRFRYFPISYKTGRFCRSPRASGGAGDRLADVADQGVDQRRIVRLAHHPDDRLGAGRVAWTSLSPLT